HGAEYPATRVELDARQAFEQALVEEGVIVSSDAVPAGGDRPLRGKIDLPDGAAAEAVARVDPLRHLRVVAHRRGVALGPLVVAVVLQRAVERPVTEQSSAD